MYTFRYHVLNFIPTDLQQFIRDYVNLIFGRYGKQQHVADYQHVAEAHKQTG